MVVAVRAAERDPLHRGRHPIDQRGGGEDEEQRRDEGEATDDHEPVA